jgi:predicted TIM-barrel fold metal-dependent hydrolase
MEVPAMRMLLLLIVFLAVCSVSFPENPPPIIDMHMHASELAWFEKLGGPAPIPHCVPMTDYLPESGSKYPEVFRSRTNDCKATWSPKTDQEIMAKNLELMKRHNIYGVVSGSRLSQWKEKAPGRIIPAYSIDDLPKWPSPDEVRKQYEAGDFKVFGELAVQYGGMTPDDPSLEPYWALLEDLDVPVGIHIGTGPVGAPYLGFDKYRAKLHSALVLEEVLAKHPKLRVYIMHAGWPNLEDLLAVLWTHPHVYIDTGAISWALPRKEFHHYLQRVVEAGFAKRILFGSDQMIWPDALEMAIESIQSADFLTAEQKRDIFFNNAVRFLRLTPQQVETMQGGQ